MAAARRCGNRYVCRVVKHIAIDSVVEDKSRTTDLRVDRFNCESFTCKSFKDISVLAGLSMEKETHLVDNYQGFPVKTQPLGQVYSLIRSKSKSSSNVLEFQRIY